MGSVIVVGRSGKAIEKIVLYAYGDGLKVDEYECRGKEKKKREYHGDSVIMWVDDICSEMHMHIIMRDQGEEIFSLDLRKARIRGRIPGRTEGERENFVLQSVLLGRWLHPMRIKLSDAAGTDLFITPRRIILRDEENIVKEVKDPDLNPWRS